MEKIYQGAEAILFKDKNKVIKERISKSYRHQTIDFNLRAFRTRREAKVLEKLKQIGFPAPKVISLDDQKMVIEMDFIKGKKLKEVFEENYQELSQEIGKKIALLHQNNIIHGDLTTNNMILNKEVYFLDFGLSFFSQKAEDKAVDLYLLSKCLETGHSSVFPHSFDLVLKAYCQEYPQNQEIIKRLSLVEKRGRHKKRN